MSFIAVGIGAAGLALSAYSTFSSASAQRGAGVAQNQAAQINAAGAQYKAENSAETLRFQADLTDWAAKTNESYAMARADRVETEAAANVDIMRTSTSRAMGRAVGAYVAAGVEGGGSPLLVLNDMASEGKLQQDLQIYGAKVSAGDIRAQATIDTTKAGMQAAIFRANATVEQSMGNFAASAYRSGGAAAQAGADSMADSTLLTGLGKTAIAGAPLVAGAFSGGGSGPQATSPAAAMSAYSSLPTSYTNPGF